MIHIVICLCTDRAIKRKESSTPELFQIANGCNQSVGSQEQGYTAAFPLVFIQRQVEEKVPNNQLESLLVKLTAVQVPSPACEPSRPLESVQGEQSCFYDVICQSEVQIATNQLRSAGQATSSVRGGVEVDT